MRPAGTSVMHFGIVGMPLLDGSFTFALGIQSRGGVLYDWQEPAGTFEVMNPGKTTGVLRMDVHAALISSREQRRLRCRAGAAALSKTRTMSDTEPTLPADPQAYVEQVMAEIAEEVRLRRASGDLPPKLERELDELFLAHSPVAGRGGDLGEALRMVDAATFIDPVVPVESERAAGAVVKKGMRSLLLWYVGWITHQMSQSASAVSRALHIVDDRLKELERQVEVQRVAGGAVVEFPALHGPDAWWVEPAVAAVAKAPGRVLHAACGDGWLVRRIDAAGGRRLRGRPPRPPRRTGAELGMLDLRGEGVAEHLRAVAAGGPGRPSC